MIEEIFLAESQMESESLGDSKVSNWKKDVIDVVGRIPTGTNFFLAETYLRFDEQNEEPLLGVLMNEDGDAENLFNRLTAKRLWETPVWTVFDQTTRSIRFRYVTLCYPFRVAEEVIAPLCKHPDTSLITTFVNAKKKGYSEKRVALEPSEVRSTAYWGMKRKATLPMHLWAYDLVKCDPELEGQTYSRRVFPIFSSEHMEDYMRTGKVCEEADYQFFLDGMYSYIDLSRSWYGVKELESEWEELNKLVGTNCSERGDRE